MLEDGGFKLPMMPSDVKRNSKKSRLIKELQEVPNIAVACKKIRISRSTFYRWRKRDLDFSQESDKALRVGVDQINDFAVSALLTQIKNGNTTATIYWLKHNHPLFNGTKKHPYYERSSEDDELDQEIIEKVEFLTAYLDPRYRDGRKQFPGKEAVQRDNTEEGYEEDDDEEGDF